jgi:hypothetical protein
MTRRKVPSFTPPGAEMQTLAARTLDKHIRNQVSALAAQAFPPRYRAERSEGLRIGGAGANSQGGDWRPHPHAVRVRRFLIVTCTASWWSSGRGVTQLERLRLHQLLRGTSRRAASNSGATECTEHANLGRGLPTAQSGHSSRMTQDVQDDLAIEIAQELLLGGTCVRLVASIPHQRVVDVHWAAKRAGRMIGRSVRTSVTPVSERRYSDVAVVVMVDPSSPNL